MCLKDSLVQVLHDLPDASSRTLPKQPLRKHLDLRLTPQIAFRPDRSMEHAAHIQSLLAGLQSHQREEGE